MSEAMPAYVSDYLGETGDEDDVVITDFSRARTSLRDRQRLEKWKQNLRVELIRERFEAQKKKSAADKPALLRLLALPRLG